MTKRIFKVVIWPFRAGMSFIASLAPLFGMPRPFFMLFVGLVLPIIFIAILAQLWLHGRVVLVGIGILFVLAVLYDIVSLSKGRVEVGKKRAERDRRASKW